MQGARSIRGIRTLTRSYQALQGLRKAPIGLLLLLGGVLTPVAEWSQAWDRIHNLLVLVPILALYWLIDRYYRREYGYVQYSRVEVLGNTKLILKGAASVIGALGGIVAALWVDLFVSPLVSVTGMFVAACLLLSCVLGWRETGRFGVHYAVMAVLLAATSLLPMAGLVPTEGYVTTVLPPVLGTILLIGGILDHMTLRRSLPLMPEAPEEPRESRGRVF